MLKVLSEFMETASPSVTGAAFALRANAKIQSAITPTAMRGTALHFAAGWQSVAQLRVTIASFAASKDVTVARINLQSADPSLISY
jgi:hypothetical protein